MGILEPFLKSVTMDSEISPSRKDLQHALGTDLYLPNRETFHVGTLPVHCEIYEYHLDAPVLLFLPGIGTYGELYAELLTHLSRKGFNVVAIDPPGHGYSGGERGLYTVDSVVESVALVLDALEQRYDGPFHIYGYSIGALLAAAVAERDSRISTVVCGTLLTPDIAPDLFHYIGWQWTWANALLFPGVKMPLALMVDFDRLLAGHPAGQLINQDDLMVLDYPMKTLSSLFNHRCGFVRKEYPFRLKIVQGQDDDVLTMEYSRRVVSESVHPIELIAVAGEGHMIPLTAPLKLAGVIADCLVD